MLTVERALGPRRRCRVRCSDRADGDAGDPSFLGSERDRWSLPHQVHGAAVTLVSTPGEGTGGPVDALVTDRAGPVLAVRTADCVPIAVYGSSSVAAVHAGWKGLEAGVVEAAVAEMRRIDGGPFRAVVGPHIGTAAYEFGSADLRRLADRWGDEIIGRTASGTPALDLGAAVETVLRGCDVGLDHRVGRCTATDARYYSHRARREPERMVMLVELLEGGDVDG